MDGPNNTAVSPHDCYEERERERERERGSKWAVMTSSLKNRPTNDREFGGILSIADVQRL